MRHDQWVLVMGGAPLPVREFADATAMRAHYAALRDRLWNPPSVRPQTRPGITMSLAEVQRGRLEREREERLRSALAERERLDALVFQILDPATLAREPKRIIARVAERFGVPVVELTGPSRQGAVMRARHAAIAAVREARPDLSLPQMGRVFNRDHTSILHALRVMAKTGVPQPPETRAAK